MMKVPATHFTRNFGRYRDAAQWEPIAVTNHERVTSVLLSPRHFAEYQRLKRQAQRIEEMAE